jgi:hypothetical protein
MRTADSKSNLGCGRLWQLWESTLDSARRAHTTSPDHVARTTATASNMSRTFSTPVPARLSKAKREWLLRDDVQFDVVALDFPGQAFCTGEVIVIEGREVRYGILAGFRQWDCSLAYPGHVAIMRVMKSLSALEHEVDADHLEKHRQKAVFLKHPEILAPDRELVATSEYIIVTDRELVLKSRKIMCLEPLRMVDVLGKGHRSREFDCYLTVAERGLVDFAEWWFVDAMAVWDADQELYDLAPLEPLENTTLKSSGSFVPVTYNVSPPGSADFLSMRHVN